MGWRIEHCGLPWIGTLGRWRVSPWKYKAYSGDRWSRAGIGLALHLVRRRIAPGPPQVSDKLPRSFKDTRCKIQSSYSSNLLKKHVAIGQAWTDILR